MEIYDSKKWDGCFGVMSVIRHEFLRKIVDKYNLFNIINDITCRDHRCSFERVFAVLCYAEKDNSISYFGDIHKFIKWGFNYKEYKSNVIQKDIIKVWSGR